MLSPALRAAILGLCVIQFLVLPTVSLIDGHHSPQGVAIYLLLCFSGEVRQVLGTTQLSGLLPI